MAQLAPVGGPTGVEAPVVTPEDVVGELGKVISEDAMTFPEETRLTSIGKWIEREQILALDYVSWDPASTDNTAAEIIMLEDAILYRVCARALRHCQANRRMGVDGPAPSYSYLIMEYERKAAELLSTVLRERVTCTVTQKEIATLYPESVSDDPSISGGKSSGYDPHTDLSYPGDTE